MSRNLPFPFSARFFCLNFELTRKYISVLFRVLGLGKFNVSKRVLSFDEL
jgi:hypothetical protein